MAALDVHLPVAQAGRVLVAEAPQTPQLPIGITALTDCSLITSAQEKGFFQEQGQSNLIP